MSSLLIYYQHTSGIPPRTKWNFVFLMTCLGTTSVMSILPAVVLVASSHTQNKIRASATKFISQLLASSPSTEVLYPPSQLLGSFSSPGSSWSFAIFAFD